MLVRQVIAGLGREIGRQERGMKGGKREGRKVIRVVEKILKMPPSPRFSYPGYSIKH